MYADVLHEIYPRKMLKKRIKKILERIFTTYFPLLLCTYAHPLTLPAFKFPFNIEKRTCNDQFFSLYTYIQSGPEWG